ncbi:MAG: FAD:protein FMN transferase, partial [Proteobacteria bacterium]|nr:FAD:protein FMN transferase [Pseudomonadota bacterium]
HLQQPWLRVGIAIIVSTLSLAFFLTQGQNFPKVFKLSGATMGTEYRVVYRYQSPSSSSPQNRKSPSYIRQRITAILQELNQQVSTYIPDSQISQFNRWHSTEPFVVSFNFFHILQQAKDIFTITGGAFDPTVAPLINLWGFGEASDTELVLPSDSDITKQMDSVGFELITFHEQTMSIQKNKPSVAVNLSSIAKGYGVDLIARFLDELAIDDYLVEIGGEVRAKGKNAQEQYWQIAIESPNSEWGDVSASTVVPLNHQSVATSGSYRNYFDRDGRRYSHIIEPKSGYPVNHSTVSVTVMADECVVADGLATAFLVLGVEEGLKLADQRELKVLFTQVSRHQDPGVMNKLVTTPSRHWSAYIAALN